MVSIPTAFIYTYGILANNKKQAWLIYGMVAAIFIVFVIITAINEYQGNPLVNALLGSQQPNLEGKEVRFGVGTISLVCGDNNRNDVRCSNCNA